ncbi:MAG: GDP-mannose 4,6-dehydratase, partial [Planctomycetes bacterium]|nr:GDP-mannose 4,6-dehydratase [Planctomycetota bacterium]
MNSYLVTGSAGFVGSHLAKALLARGEQVLGVDNLNDYYSVQLKRDRLAQLADQSRFSFHRIDLADREAIDALFQEHRFPVVLNMAAQAGVRYSLS